VVLLIVDFFLPFEGALVLVDFVFVLVVDVSCPANTAMPLRSERPSIRLMIFFIGVVVLLGEVLVEINYTIHDYSAT